MVAMSIDCKQRYIFPVVMLHAVLDCKSRFFIAFKACCRNSAQKNSVPGSCNRINKIFIDV